MLHSLSTDVFICVMKGSVCGCVYILHLKLSGNSLLCLRSWLPNKLQESNVKLAEVPLMR